MKLNGTKANKIFEAMIGENYDSGSSSSSFSPIYLGLCYREPEVNSSGAVTDAYEITDVTDQSVARNYARHVIKKGELSRTYQSHAEGDTSAQTHQYRIGNKDQIAFPEALRHKLLPNAKKGGMWKTATHWGLWAQETGGNPFLWGELEEPITVDTHEVFIIRAGHMEIYLEPDKENIYWGLFSTEDDFKNALNKYSFIDEEGEHRAALTIPEGLNIIKNKNSRGIQKLEVTIPAENTKHLFFAVPTDFDGKPMFRRWKSSSEEYDQDANGDYKYSDYDLGYAEFNETVYTTSHYIVDTTLVAPVASQRLSQINCPGGAPSFTSAGATTTNPYVGPYYEIVQGEERQVSTLPENWSTTYTNYYYKPKVILVNRENAYFIYEVFPVLPETVENPSGNPSTSGYYEQRNEKVNSYIKSTDTSVIAGKTYYNFPNSSDIWEEGNKYIRMF